MEQIIKAFLEGLVKLPKAFGSSPLGGAMIVFLLAYAMYLGKPILSEYLKQVEKPDVKKIDSGPNNSGTYKINSRV